MSIIALYLIFSMLAVLWLDLTRYLIPNWLVASLLIAYPLAVWLAPHPVEWKSALAAAVMVFAIGYVVFIMKWMGGGDIKLLTACTLWVGFQYLLDFLFIVTLIGGVYAVVLWGTRKVIPHIPRKNTELPRMLREGEPIAYGLAIAVGFLLMIGMGNIPAIK